MGLLLNVYKTKRLGDCTNGGISSSVDKVTLVDAEGPFEPSDDAPAVKLVERQLGMVSYLHVEPVDPPKEGNVGWMSGGNFVTTFDSRFPSQYPLALHDRQETPEQYRSLST